MVEQYEINPSTLAILPIGKTQSQVIEEGTSFLVAHTPTEIINHSCRFFGSSYAGRVEGTKDLLGVSYKAPIVIEESMELIFFPTSSPRFDNCIWISLEKVKRFEKDGIKSKIIFSNEEILPLSISFGSLQNQCLRATRLQVVLRSRKLNK